MPQASQQLPEAASGLLNAWTFYRAVAVDLSRPEMVAKGKMQMDSLDWTVGWSGKCWRKASVRCTPRHAFATSGVRSSVDRGHRSQPHPCLPPSSLQLPSPPLPLLPTRTTSIWFGSKFPQKALGSRGECSNQNASSPGPGPGPRPGRCCELESPMAPVAAKRACLALTRAISPVSPLSLPFRPVVNLQRESLSLVLEALN